MVGVKLFLEVLRIYMKKGSMKYGGLDFEAEGAMVEVQKGREILADWTLKWSETRRKSKRDEKERRIGR